MRIMRLVDAYRLYQEQHDKNTSLPSYSFHMSFSKVERLMSCKKKNLETTSPIFSPNLYQPPHLKNVFEGLVWDGFESCKIQGGVSLEN